MDNNAIVSKLTTEEGDCSLYAGGELVFVNKMPEDVKYVVRYNSLPRIWEGEGGTARLYDHRANITANIMAKTATLCNNLSQALFSWVNDDSILGAIFDMVREATKGIFALLERK